MSLTVALSKGKLRFSFVDPGEDEKEKRKVQALGIPEVRLDIISKDKFEAAPAFLGLGLFYEDKKEVIPVVRSTQTLEYDLTAAIKKLTGGEVKTIGFFTKGDIRSDYATAVRALEKLYKVRKVDLKEGKPVPGSPVSRSRRVASSSGVARRSLRSPSTRPAPAARR